MNDQIPMTNDQSEIAMYWWRGETNFGDMLSPWIVRQLTGRTPAWQGEPARLLAVGSIVQDARPGDIVWGSGIHGALLDRPWSAAGITFLSVRGPLSRRYIIERGGVCPAIYGDPAMLLPSLYPLPERGRRAVAHPVAAMPHFDDRLGREFAHEAALPLIDPLADWQRVVGQIADCGVLLTSSLHGIIVAEAYGVPAIWCHGSERSEKYFDYYAATGRSVKPAGWRQALDAASPSLPRQLADERLVPALLNWSDQR